MRDSAESSASSAQETAQNFLDLGRLGKSAWWRYLLGLLIVVAGYFVFGVFWFIVIIVIAAGGKMPNIESNSGHIEGVDDMANYVAVNVPSFFLLLFTFLVVCFLHRRSIFTLISSAKFSWRRLACGFGAWFCLAALAGAVGWIIYPHSYKFEMPGVQYFSYAPLVLFLTPIQCLAEELFFRGYLLQAMGNKVRNIWLAAALNGFIFMLPHLYNPEVSYGLAPMVICYFAMGLLMALITLRTGSLEMAIGAHAANNLFDALILNDIKSVLTTKSLFVCTQGHPWYEACALIVGGVALYVVVDKYMRKRAVQVS